MKKLIFILFLFIATNCYGYDSFTKLLAHFNGTDGGTYTPDTTGKTINYVGTAQLDTTIKKFGTASLQLDGDSDYVQLDDSDDFYFDGDFVIDMWLYITGMDALGYAGIYAQDVDATHYIRIYYNDAPGSEIITFLDYEGSAVLACYWLFDIAPYLNNWFHLAVLRSGTGNFCVKAFINGVSLGNGTLAGGAWNAALVNKAAPLWIGHADGVYTLGYIDELRISKGTDRGWSGGFTPPTGEYAITHHKSFLID